MKIHSIKLKNFRSYKDEVTNILNDLTAFVGKNDIGKSTILEALDIFFNENKGVVKIDKEDVNKDALASGKTEIAITIVFKELPDKIIIDTTNETSLKSEYLLNSNGHLEIIKKYPNGGKEKVFVKANHPTNIGCKDLLQQKDAELRKLIETLGIECLDRSRNAVMRTAIWNNFISDLQLQEIEIDVTKGDVVKSIWEKLQSYLPLYSLFQSDRKNCDGDCEVQDPLKEAVKQILKDEDIQIKFNDIANEVEHKLQEVAERTLDKLREMNPEIADSLNPVIPASENLKWTDVFKNVSISGDQDIPINKRGSGVKRLVLLNFFRAEAERKRLESGTTGIIYAIEEPETSQHSEHQKILIKAFKELSNYPNTQILITTHSAIIVKELNFEHLRLITLDEQIKKIEPVIPNQLPYPSLNEVNYQAFAEVSEEYHNELYGYIESEGQLTYFKNGKSTIEYLKDWRGKVNRENLILTEYIRHQIHHPENLLNTRFTQTQLSQSIELMRSFIQSLN
jgi:predicted ATP-dependent endonuclease of OLD family